MIHDSRRCPQVEGLNIPMSVGPPSVDKDKAGDECIVYDVIINPKVQRIGVHTVCRSGVTIVRHAPVSKPQMTTLSNGVDQQYGAPARSGVPAYLFVSAPCSSALKWLLGSPPRLSWVSREIPVLC